MYMCLCVCVRVIIMWEVLLSAVSGVMGGREGRNYIVKVCPAEINQTWVES